MFDGSSDNTRRYPGNVVAPIGFCTKIEASIDRGRATRQRRIRKGKNKGKDVFHLQISRVLFLFQSGPKGVTIGVGEIRFIYEMEAEILGS
jgi:hypothetical protein